MTIKNALDRVYGQASVAIQRRAAIRFAELVPALVDDAIERWARNNWATFDATEGNCTLQLYRWLVEARRLDNRFNAFEINIENVLPTPEMMQATESIANAVRPDVRISVRDAGVLLEAKRLIDAAAWGRAYVHEGMARFVKSSYAAKEGSGMMIGYLQQGAKPAKVQTRVNSYVTSHELMGVTHVLAQDRADTNSTWLRSNHQRSSGLPIQLKHVWVSLP